MINYEYTIKLIVDIGNYGLTELVNEHSNLEVENISNHL